MQDTASPTELLFIMCNLAGFVAALGLFAVSWERRVAVQLERFPITPKAPRLRVAGRQLRDRGVRAGVHLACIVLGILAGFDANVPDEIYAVAILIIMGTLAASSIAELHYELHA